MRPTTNEPAEPGLRTDDELLAAVPGDRGAPLVALYDRYASVVYGLALRILTEPQEAEDVTQEVFLTLCDRNAYDARRGPVSAYLITMTRSRAIDRLRARGRSSKLLGLWSKNVEPVASPIAPHEQVALAERSRHVRDALAQLPESQRRVLEMAYYRGLSLSEIARQLNAPLGTVKSWARRALFTMRENLHDFVG